MKLNNLQKGLLAGAIAITVLGVSVPWARSLSPKANVETTAATSVDLDKTKADLTVDLDKLMPKKAFPEVSREFLDSSMPIQNGPRVDKAGFSTALTFPFTGASQQDDQTYSLETIKGWWNGELVEEIIRNPVYGVAVARALSELRFSDGTTLGDLNPWLKEFIAKYDSFFVEGKKGNSEFLTTEYADGPINVNDDYNRYAVGVIFLVQRFVPTEVRRTYAVRHWGLKPANDISPNFVRAEVFEDPENRDAIVAYLTSKSGTKMLSIAFNVHDKRPMIPEKQPTPEPETTPETRTPETTPETKVPKTNPKPKKKKKPTPDRETTPRETTPQETTPRETTPRETTPRETTPHETTPTTTPDDNQKKRSKDPVNNGGGKRGGDSATMGTDEIEARDPKLETGKGHGDPAKETPETPTQDVSHHTDPVVNIDQNKMNKETDAVHGNTWNKVDTHENVSTGKQENTNSGSNTGNDSGNATPLAGDGVEFNLD